MESLASFRCLRVIASLITIMALSLGLSSCGEEDSVAVDTNPSVGDPADPTTPVVDQTQIFLDVASNGWTSLMHNNTGIGDSCSITTTPGSGAATTVAEKYIDCTLEISEGSTHFRDIELAINIPAETCRYMQFNNYWFVNFDTGIGQNTMFIETQTDGSGNLLQYQCSETGFGALAACDTSRSQAISNGNTWYVNQSGEPQCVFDHNAINPDFPNCCTGDYVLNTRNNDTVNVIISNTVTSQSSFGTFQPMCFGGSAARDDTWPKSDNNIPQALITNTYVSGYSTPYLLQSPISLIANEANVNTANYYSAGVGLPNPINPSYSNSLAQTPFGSGPQQDYEIWCLDEGYEVEYSINLKIREWNTQAQFLSYITDGSGDPDLSGTEGGGGANDCEYESPEAGACNDIPDWDDYTNAFPSPAFPNMDNHYPRTRW